MDFLAVGLAAVVAALAFIYLWAMWSATNGHLAPPLDDTFIYLQYAKAISEGYLFSYVPGAPPTTGATSSVYPFLLAPGYLVGFRDEAFLIYAYALNVVFLYIVAIVVGLLTLRFAHLWEAVLASLLTVVSGPVLWGFFSMMEIGLLSVTVTMVVYFFVKEAQKALPWRTILCACALALARPEGVLMAGLVVSIIAVRILPMSLAREQQPTKEKTEPRPLLVQGALLSLPLLTGAAWLVFNQIVTGNATSTALASKSILFAPQVPWFEKIGEISSNTAILLQDPFGLNPTYLPILLFPLIGLGLGRQLGIEVQERKPGVALLVLGLFVISVLAASQAAGVLLQHYRYNIALFPLLVVFAMIGLDSLGRAFGNTRSLALGIGLLTLVLALLTSPRWIETYAENAQDIHNQQVFLGKWISGFLPSESIVALNDAGAMVYYGDHPVYDLVGLVTSGASLPFRHGTGAVFERIRSLQPSERPTYYVIYPHWFDFPVGGFLTEVYRTRLSRTSIAAGDTVVIYRADYSAAEQSERPALDHSQGGQWIPVDSLNVADLADETIHGYRQVDLLPRGRKAVTTLRENQSAGESKQLLLDGGRVVLGFEEFNVLTKRERDLKVVVRSETLAPLHLGVYANERLVGIWSVSGQEGVWAEASFVVPSQFVTEGHTRLRIVLNDLSGTNDYRPFYYWFYQPQ